METAEENSGQAKNKHNMTEHAAELKYTGFVKIQNLLILLNSTLFYLPNLF